MRNKILKINEKLRIGAIDEIEAKNLLLGLFGVVKSLPNEIEIGKAISDLSYIADKEAER